MKDSGRILGYVALWFLAALLLGLVVLAVGFGTLMVFPILLAVIGGLLTGNVDTSGNSTLFEGGATVKYGNMLFSGGLNWKDGGAYESVFGGQVSVRFSW